VDFARSNSADNAKYLRKHQKLSLVVVF
jgi:hypothetical protein